MTQSDKFCLPLVPNLPDIPRIALFRLIQTEIEQEKHLRMR